MTLKERILSWFKKEDDIQNLLLFDMVDDDEDLDFEEVLGLIEDDEFEIDVSTPLSLKDIGSKYIDKDAVEGKRVKPNLEDLIAGFKTDVPAKRAIWGGRETIAFKKWKAEKNWD